MPGLTPRLPQVPLALGALLALGAVVASPLAAQKGNGEPVPGRTDPAPFQAGHLSFRIGERPPLPAELTRAPSEHGVVEAGYFIVHFRGPVRAADRAWLDEQTGSVRRPDGSALARAYLPDDAFLVWVDGADTLARLESDERTDWVGRYEPGFKLDVGLIEAALEDREGHVRLWNVDLVPGHDPERLARELEALGARVRERVHHRGQGPYDLDFLIVEARDADWLPLARVEGIRVVRERAGDPTTPSPAGEPLTSELDSRLVAVLAARATSGPIVSSRLGQRLPDAAYDEVAALVDLLAFDDPRLEIWASTERLGANAFEPAVKNTLVLAPGESVPVGELEDEAQGVAPSAALVRARRIQAAAAAEHRSAPRGRLAFAPEPSAGPSERFVLDVPRAQGFHGPDDRPRVTRLQSDGVAPIDVTLAWTDEPGSPGTIGHRINDLDLVVVAPDGRAFRGNRFDDDGVSRTGGRADRTLTAERVFVPQPEAGTWTVTVSAARGAFALGQGYALAVRGSGLDEVPSSNQNLAVTRTAVLPVASGRNSVRGPLTAAKVQRLASSDDSRYWLIKHEQLTLTFQNTLPPEAIVGAVRVDIEHHELNRVGPGDILWGVGQGTVTDPILVGTTDAPLRNGPNAEALDIWSPGAVLDPDTLVVVVDNPNLNDGTNLDRVQVEIDYTLPQPSPRIVSVPSPTGFVGEAYAYDADGRVEADGAGPITWLAVRAPVGFSIHPTTGRVTWTPAMSGAFPVTLLATNAQGSSTQDFTVTVENAPLPSTLLAAIPRNVTYLPPERLAFGGPRAQQRVNVFLPPGPAPASGWPVVVNNRAGGGIAAPSLTQLNDTGGTAPLHAFVASGVAVVDFGVTGIGNGNGLFYPPGHPTGRYESFDRANDNPEKDAEWAVQWVKTQTHFPLDLGRICLRGSSQGAILSMWDAMGPSRARPGGSNQVQASTRVKAVLALQPPTSVWALDQSAAINTRMTQHYERASAPGTPASAFGQVDPSLQKTSSVMGFAFETLYARLHNQAQAVCLLFAEPVTMTAGAPADLSLDAAGYPNLHDTLGQPYIHDSWSGYELWGRLTGLSPDAAQFHAAHSTFAVRNTSALAPPFDTHTRTFTGDVFGAQATAIAHTWVLRELQAVHPTSPKIRPSR